MRSISELAQRATWLYPNVSPDHGTAAYYVRIEGAYRELVRRCGGFIRQTLETPFVTGQRDYTMPTDYRELCAQGLSIRYAPRTISSIARVSDVTTVVTATAHALAAGMTVRVADVTGAGGTAFDGDFEVASVSASGALGVDVNDTFTYADEGDDDTGSVLGTVGQASDVRYPAYARIEEMSLLPHGEGAEEGIPQYYSFKDKFTVVFDPVPDGSVPAFTIEYDAHPSSSLTITEDLVGPEWLEEVLIDCAALRMGAIRDKGQQIMAAQAWDEAAMRWTAEISRAAQQNSR